MDVTRCYCGSGHAFDNCCKPFLEGNATPATAEQLMRSRYSAFAAHDKAYLLSTWHPRTRPSGVRLDEAQRWLGLKIRAVSAGGPSDDTGLVEFVARFKVAGKGHRLHELSRFEKIDCRWYYLDGTHL